MKKIVIALAVLVVLLVGAVLIGPSFIDWNSYKGQIVAAIKDNTGRDAAIDGDIAFSLLPAPALSVEALRIANFDGAQATEMLQLKELRVRVAIGALLERRIVVEQLELIEPVIALEIADDGKASWDVQIAAGENATASAEDGSDSAPLNISLANVVVSGGSVSFHDRRSGTSEKVEDLQMTVSARSLSGPFDMTGSMQARGVSVLLELTTGSIKPDQPLTFNFKAILPEHDAEIRFKGQLLQPIPTGLLSGNLEIAVSDATRLAAAVGQTSLPALLAQPVLVNGTLMASPDAVAINVTAIKLGTFSGNGAVSVTLGDPIKVDLAVSVSRLNLDELLNQVAPADTKVPENSKPAAADIPAAAEVSAGSFALPKNIDASFDLAVDVIQYRGSVIRQAGVRAEMSNGEVTLERAAALLPGGSDVSLVGILSFIEGEPRFDGQVAAASDNLRSLLDWAGVDASVLPADRLRGFSYASRVKVTPITLEVHDINVRLDASTMTGGLTVALRDRLGFGLRLAIYQLNLDAYLPRKGSSVLPSESVTASKGKPASVTSKSSILAILDTFDANIDLEISRLTVQNTLARKVRFDGLLAGGDLKIREGVVAGFAGAQAEISGDIKDLKGTPTAGLDYHVAVNYPAKLFRFLGVAPPIALRKLGKPNLSGRIDGKLEAITFESDIAAADVAVALKGVVKNILTAPSFEMWVAVNHQQLAEFVRLVVPDFQPAAKQLGPLDATFRLSGTPTDLKISELDATVGPVTMKGTATVRTDGPKPYVSAEFSTSEVLLDLFLAPRKQVQSATARGRAASADGNGASRPSSRWSRDPMDFSGIKDIDADLTLTMASLISDKIHLSQPIVEAALKSGRLDLKRFQAGLFGGTVLATGHVDSNPSAPPIGIDLTVSNVDLAQAAKTLGAPPRATGPFSVDASLTAAGNSEAALVSSLSGSGAVSGKIQIKVTKQENQAIGAIGLASVLFGNKVKELKQVGSVTNELFSAFGRTPAALAGTFAVQRGILQTRDTVLKGRGAQAVTAGTVNLPRWLVNTNTSVFRAGRQEPLVSVALTGPLDSPNPKTSGSFLKSSRSAPASNLIQQILPGALGSKQGSGDSGKVQPSDVIKELFGRFVK